MLTEVSMTPCHLFQSFVSPIMRVVIEGKVFENLVACVIIIKCRYSVCVLLTASV